MKSSHVLILAFAGATAAFVYYSLRGGVSPEDYAKEILKEREEKANFLNHGQGSPFATSDEEFKSLNYYAPELKYRVTAKLIPVQEKKVTILPTSDGKEQKYLDYAHAVFSFEDVENKLLILEVMEMGPERGKLFLAFADETSGKETYGGGRYLDLKKVPAATTVLLDFNTAYNPYCAYNDSYSCPFPPAENILKIAIKAGERIYHR